MIICDTDMCTGCGACESTCPAKCITMQEDNFGERHPVINQSKCLNCKKCVRTCPINTKPNYKEPVSVFAGCRVDEHLQLDSASGGIAAVLSEYYIKELGGLVYGTRYDEEFNAVVSCADNLNSIELFKGSKYVQSDASKTYTEVKKHLNSGKHVLYFGTPCQLAALYAVLGEKVNTDTLCTVEILCHGVCPNAYLKDEIAYLKKKKHIKHVDNVTFRTNRRALDFYFTMWNQGKVVFDQTQFLNNYFAAFLKGVSLRESCFQCQYKSTNRIGDILIGDFIGLGKSIPFEGNPRHKSLIITYSSKGEELLSNCGENLQLWERGLDEALIEGRSLRESFPKPKEQKLFRTLLPQMGFVKASSNVLKDSIHDFRRKNWFDQLKLRIKKTIWRLTK